MLVLHKANAVGLGSNASVTGVNAVGLGTNVKASNSDVVAIGTAAKTETAGGGIAIGQNAYSKGLYGNTPSVAIGKNSIAMVVLRLLLVLVRR